MLNTAIANAAMTFLNGKYHWSAWNDRVMWWATRSPLPTFTSPQACWEYFRTHGNPYTGDPAMGIGDHYAHPGRVQAVLIGAAPAGSVYIDCDDTAGWVASCLRKSGISAEVRTLVDATISMSHVLAVGIFNGRAWVIDTNGYHELPDLNERTLVDHWNRIYTNARYVACVPTPYPFS